MWLYLTTEYAKLIIIRSYPTTTGKERRWCRCRPWPSSAPRPGTRPTSWRPWPREWEPRPRSRPSADPCRYIIDYWRLMLSAVEGHETLKSGGCRTATSVASQAKLLRTGSEPKPRDASPEATHQTGLIIRMWQIEITVGLVFMEEYFGCHLGRRVHNMHTTHTFSQDRFFL